jgi:hypothetical protein
VVGAIAPVDPKAPPIRFEVNFPTQWNGSSVQFGGWRVQWHAHHRSWPAAVDAV